MKKVLFIVLAAALVMGAAGVRSAAAQKFELGARAGIGSQSMKFQGNSFWAKSQFGWHLAAVSRIRIVGFGGGVLGAGLFFQPEVVYSQNNNKVSSNLDYPVSTRASSDYDWDMKLKVQTVDVPLLLSVKVSFARVQAGPVFHLMSDFSSRNDQHLNMRLPQRPLMGYAIGASVDLLGITIDGRYYGDIGKLKSGINDGGHFHDSVKSSLSSWSVGVGIMF